jgi:hypothetical protein
MLPARVRKELLNISPVVACRARRSIAKSGFPLLQIGMKFSKIVDETRTRDGDERA